MGNYRETNNKYNLNEHLKNKEIIEAISNLLSKKNISESELIDIINILADFMQYNNEYYSNIKPFIDLADKLVNIIENFGDEDCCQAIIKDELNIYLNKFDTYMQKYDNINLFFYGVDKYNILKTSINHKIVYIENIDEYKNLYKQHDNSQINILIYSEESQVCDLDLDFKLYFNDVVYYDKTMNYMFDISNKIYYSNYDYNYLLKSLEKSKDKDIETIVVGNSYPLTGINTNLLVSKSISLALSSQDLYYSYKLAKLAIDNNKSIKRCIIGGGYYLVNHDLSKSKSDYSVNLIKNTYYPILKDKHNLEVVDCIELLNIEKVLNDKVLEYTFNLENLDYYFKDLIYRDNNGYFNINFKREMNSILRGTKLSDISELEKYRLGKERANQHNKLSSYSQTKEEYKCIFNQFINFLKEKNIEPIIVVFPNTKYYSEFLNKEYECEFYKILNEIEEKFKIKLIDFTKEGIFEECDFIDLDHIGEIGSVKITNLINQYLSV
ncbi:MAG: hypothetical protein ACRCYC_13895 [Paraclostridium sp.]|uniref:hypothetical protein n=1 Tax=Paraclostridium sp. TaxID=2023273 RepID=UPI003F394B5E